jgi:hypothetical protein
MTIQRRVACWFSKATRAQAHAHARAPTAPHTHTHISTHEHAHIRECARTTHTHTQKYVIVLVFPRQHWFCESASLLRYMYSACLVSRIHIITESCISVSQYSVMGNGI